MSQELMNMAKWVANQYPHLANHPMHLSRTKEYGTMKEYAEHYGIELSLEDFDKGIAQRFGFGCDYEWGRD